MTTRSAIALLCLSFLGACAPTSPRTQITVNVTATSDLESQLDGVVISVRGGALRSGAVVFGDARRFEARGRIVWPVSLAVVPAGNDATRQIEVVVTGLSGTDEVVTARRVGGFVAGETRVLEVPLASACVRVSCTGGSTCAGGTCGSANYEPSTLPRLGIDGGTRDSGGTTNGDGGNGATDTGPIGPMDTGPTAQTDMGPTAQTDMGPTGTTDTGPTGTTDAGPTDAGPAPPPCQTGSCQTLRFIVSTMAIPPIAAGPTVNDPSTVEGFNIDGNSVDECLLGPAQAELIGAAPDNLVGVDASLNGMLAGLVGDAFQAPIVQGQLVILVELTDVDDRVNDANVTLSLYTGRLRPGVTLPMLTGGRIAPGQAFDVVGASLMANGLSRYRWPLTRITEGRVRTPASAVTFALPLALAGSPLPFSLRKTQVAFNLSADGLSLSSGLLGAATAPADLSNWLCCGGSACTLVGGMVDKCCSTAERAMNLPICANDVQGLPLPASSIVGLILSAADLTPDLSGMCTEASISYSLAGVAATFDPTMPVAEITDAGPRDSGPLPRDLGPRG